jgi:hypothetical protein
MQPLSEDTRATAFTLSEVVQSSGWSQPYLPIRFPLVTSKAATQSGLHSSTRSAQKISIMIFAKNGLNHVFLLTTDTYTHFAGPGEPGFWLFETRIAQSFR